MKLKEKVFVLKDHVWQDRISIVFTNSCQDSVKDQVENHGLPESYLLPDDADAVVLHVDEPNYKALFAVFPFNVSDSIIVHECMHLCVYLLHRRQLELDYATQEAYAYTMQWLFDNITKFRKLAKKK